MTIKKPNDGEFAPYASQYISKVTEGDVRKTIEDNFEEFLKIYLKISEKQANFAYAEGKWTIKELLGHINDAERIFAYRALRIYREDMTELASFEQDDYIKTGKFNERTWSSIVEEYKTIRLATISLFKSFNLANIDIKGKAGGNTVTPRALMYIIAGHEIHHVQILKERYLSAMPEEA